MTTVQCDHAHVRLETMLYARETRFQPAEYLHRYVCEDCGEDLGEDRPEDAEVKDA